MEITILCRSDVVEIDVNEIGDQFVPNRADGSYVTFDVFTDFLDALLVTCRHFKWLRPLVVLPNRRARERNEFFVSHDVSLTAT
jgi:hypothetical protein